MSEITEGITPKIGETFEQFQARLLERRVPYTSVERWYFDMVNGSRIRTLEADNAALRERVSGLEPVRVEDRLPEEQDANANGEVEVWFAEGRYWMRQGYKLVRYEMSKHYPFWRRIDSTPPEVAPFP